MSADKPPEAPRPANFDIVMDLPISVTVRLGSTRMRIADLLKLDVDSVVELNQSATDPLDIVANHKVLARGEVVVVDDRLGIRITELVTQEDVSEE